MSKYETVVGSYWHVPSRLHMHGILNKIRKQSFLPLQCLPDLPLMNNKRFNSSWWRDHFLNHPDVANNNLNAFVEFESGITKVTKVYCKLCFPEDVTCIMNEDIHVVIAG